jgi:RND family efflux transporter MFP subunit
MKKYILMLTAVFLLSGCTQNVETQVKSSTKAVKTTEITSSNANDVISLSGNVVPSEQASVSFKLAGVIDEVYVNAGDTVKKGDKLASLKSSDYQLQLDAANASVAGASAQAETAGAGISAAQAQADGAQAQIKTAQASLDAAIAARDTAQLQIDTEIPSKIEQAKQQLDLTQTNYDNIVKLYNSGVATKNQYDEICTKLEVDKQTYQQALDAKTVAESQLKSAQAQIDAATSTKQAAESSYNAAIAQVNAAKSTTSAANAQTGAANAQKLAAENSLNDTVIYSPIDGVVLKKVMNNSETVAAGTPIVVIGNTDKIWVRVGVPDSYINKVQKGQRAVIHVYGVDDSVDDSIEGVVDEVGALADTTTRTFTVNIAVDNKDSLLKSGMICTADIITGNDTKVLIPVDSVISLPEGDVVYTLDGNKAKKTPVTVGDINGDKITVTNGLEIGDRLVTEGQFVLNDGDAVTATEVSGND